MKCPSSACSRHLVKEAHSDLHWSLHEASRKEHLAQSLQVIERQRRIADRLAVFEREMMTRAALTAQTTEEAMV